MQFADKLKIAVAEAERFLARANDYQDDPPRYDFGASKVGGAVRRSSMDLTRALADLRRVS